MNGRKTRDFVIKVVNERSQQEVGKMTSRGRGHAEALRKALGVTESTSVYYVPPYYRMVSDRHLFLVMDVASGDEFGYYAASGGDGAKVANSRWPVGS